MNTSTTTTAAITTAAIAGLVAITKKLLPGKKNHSPEHITRLEFHHAMEATRDRIDASHSAMAEKLDIHHREILARFDWQEARIDALATGLARVDERTSR